MDGLQVSRDLPINVGVNPRIRTSVLMLALAILLAAPATASASGWATFFSTATTCLVDSGPYTASATDDITVPVGFQNADINVNLAGTNVDQYQWMVDCGSIQSAAAGVALVAGDGQHRFSHRVREAGNSLWTPWVDDTVYVDASTPVNGTATSTAWRTGPVTVPLTVSDSVSIVHGEWKVDAAPSWTVGNTATVAGTGTHTLWTAAVDQAGNRDERSQLVRVDDTVPVDNTAVPGAIQQDFADITLNGADAGDQSGVANVVWQLDGGTATPGNNGDVLHVTANGTHTLKTYVVDNVGNQSNPVTQTFQVDSAGPVDTTTVPSGWVTTATQDVTISGTDTNGGGITLTEWQIPEDGRSGSAANGNPINLTISGEGVHTLQVRLTDGYGHVTGWTDHVVQIDSTLPVDHTSISSAWQPATSVDVTVNGTDLAPGSGVDHVEWKIDGTPAQMVGDTGTAVVTGQGEHVVETRVTDIAGNTTGWVPHTVRLDSTAPTNLTQVGDPGWRNTAWSAVVNGSDSDSGVASVEWRIDNGGVTSGTSGIETARVTADGSQHLWTRIKDIAGNYSSWRDDPIKIDTVKPTDTTAAPGGPVANGHKIPVTATDGLSGPSGSVRWWLDSGAMQTSAQATIVGAGPHTLKTQVQDNAGNWSDVKSTAVTVDMGLPYEDIDAPIDNTVVPTTWQTGPTTVAVSADDGGNTGVAKVEWRVDGQPIQHADGDHGSFTVSVDGVHDVSTRATDVAGNTSAWKPATLMIDSTLPVDTTALPTGWTNTRTFTLSATDATSGVDKIEYKINGVVQPTIASGATITLPSDGTFTIGHRVYDVAGQLTSYVYDTVKVDTVGPASTSAAAPTTWQVTPLSLDITGTDADSGIDHAEWKLGATGTVHDHDARGDLGRHADALHARRRQGRQRVRVASGEHQGRHDQAFEHDGRDRLRLAAHEPPRLR